MKCQNCGRDGVNFHYTSNINGCMTETHLCSECAAKLGYDYRESFGMGSIFDGFVPALREFLPIMEFNAAYPFGAPPQLGILVQNNNCGGSCSCGTQATTVTEQVTEVDDEMQRRREINVIREKMRAAAENEDFEKAAELRDMLSLKEKESKEP